MNESAAYALVTKMESAWPHPRWSQAKLDFWREDVATLEEGAAGTAFVQLRRESKTCPTFAELRVIAKGLNVKDASLEVKCGYCDGNGWVRPFEGADYVEPCKCEMGDGPRNATAKRNAERRVTEQGAPK